MTSTSPSNPAPFRLHRVTHGPDLFGFRPIIRIRWWGGNQNHPSAANPNMARERTELVPLVRLHPYGAHMIVYVERDEGILIVRVLHGRQDWQQLFS